jgi:Leucine-rich repeat (LRR) protein
MEGYYSISNGYAYYNNFEEFLRRIKDVLIKFESGSKIFVNTIYFSHNGLEKINKLIEKLLHYDNMYDINISHNNLEIIPINLFKLNITSLDISNNDLITIPNEICKLTNLKSLAIGNNNFYVFPKVICKLKNLEILYFKNTSLEIPFEIKNLQKLVSFDYNKKSLILYDLQNLQYIKDKKLLFRLFFIIQKNNKICNYKIINNIIKF